MAVGFVAMGAFGWSESFRPAGWFGLFPSHATVHLSAATVFLSHKTSRYIVLASFFQTSARGHRSTYSPFMLILVLIGTMV